ncbi:MAG: hypothetical protein N4A74_17845 [Carboxylicivirga sp.]|jgi:hypothetical protein|nr:hypothetical protein [Carboxylicivirga sp.]
MWFKKKIELFNHPLIETVDKELSSILKIDLITTDSELMERLSKEEQKQSGIASSDLLSIYEKKKEELMKFTCYCYSKESKIEHVEEYPNPEDNKQDNSDSKTIGLSKGFSITYAIYYYFLSTNDNKGLMDYLSVRRIPYFKKFHERLYKYFFESKGVMLSDSYIQYAAGYDKESVTIEDIDKAIKDVQEMDEEHGAFGISILMDNDEEYVIEVNKRQKISVRYGEKIDFQYDSQDWNEVKHILKMHIDKKFDDIIAKVKK